VTAGAEPERHSADGPGGDGAHVHQDWLDDLRRLVTLLGEMVTSYEGKPRNIDSSLDATEQTIGSINENVRNLCGKGGRALGEDTWNSFKGEEDNYAGFYKMVWMALDTYEVDLVAYKLVGPDVQPRPERSDFLQMDENAERFTNRRWACIEALRDLYDQLSSMLDLSTG
jgi:hypothetical protein